MSSQVTKPEVYDTLIESQEWNFTMSVKLTKVHKGELLTLTVRNISSYLTTTVV